MFFTKLAVGKH